MENLCFFSYQIASWETCCVEPCVIGIREDLKKGWRRHGRSWVGSPVVHLFRRDVHGPQIICSLFIRIPYGNSTQLWKTLPIQWCSFLKMVVFHRKLLDFQTVPAAKSQVSALLEASLCQGFYNPWPMAQGGGRVEARDRSGMMSILRSGGSRTLVECSFWRACFER